MIRASWEVVPISQITHQGMVANKYANQSCGHTIWQCMSNLNHSYLGYFGANR